jgi:hypothetical protein
MCSGKEGGQRFRFSGTPLRSIRFAYAHAALELVPGTFGEAAQSRNHTEQAYGLRDRVSEWERLFIRAQCHDRVTRELDRILATCEVWVQTYPHDPHRA